MRLSILIPLVLLVPVVSFAQGAGNDFNDIDLDDVYVDGDTVTINSDDLDVSVTGDEVNVRDNSGSVSVTGDSVEVDGGDAGRVYVDEDRVEVTGQGQAVSVTPNAVRVQDGDSDVSVTNNRVMVDTDDARVNIQDSGRVSIQAQGTDIDLDNESMVVSFDGVTVVDIETDADVVSYGNTIAEALPQVNTVSILEDRIEVSYPTEGKLFGFIPMNFDVQIEVDVDGVVNTKAPWYSFLIFGKKTSVIESDIQARIAADAVTINGYTDVRKKAEFVNVVTDVLETKVAIQDGAVSVQDGDTDVQIGADGSVRVRADGAEVDLR